jgi:hypothetical protein
VFDMIRRRSLRTRHIKMLVLDEADEMLSQGFKEQIYDVYRYLPPQTQVSFDCACAWCRRCDRADDEQDLLLSECKVTTTVSLVLSDFFAFVCLFVSLMLCLVFNIRL